MSCYCDLTQHDCRSAGHDHAFNARVVEALKRATGENGVSFADCEPAEIAEDITTFDADFELHFPDELIPGVRLWLAGK